MATEYGVVQLVGAAVRGPVALVMWLFGIRKAVTWPRLLSLIICGAAVTLLTIQVCKVGLLYYQQWTHECDQQVKGNGTYTHCENLRAANNPLYYQPGTQADCSKARAIVHSWAFVRGFWNVVEAAPSWADVWLSMESRLTVLAVGAALLLLVLNLAQGGANWTQKTVDKYRLKERLKQYDAQHKGKMMKT
jgi:hypothetical protein